MANGILDLETDDNKQDENLFLSAPEQRGLEAATFATAIGAAPSTGNIFGDLLSVAAQTGPAALATFKERQSIKEKEAEYKDKINKKKSLATKYVALKSDPDNGFYELESEIAKFPQLYTQGPKQTVSRLKVYRKLPNGNKIITNVSISDWENDKDEDGINQTLQLIEDRQPYYVWKKNADESTAVPKALSQGELQEYAENYNVSLEAPQGLINFQQQQKQKTDDASTNLNNAINEYKAAGGVVRLKNEIMQVLEGGGAEALPGGVGGIAIGLESFRGAIESGFKAAFDVESKKDKDLFDEVSFTLERYGADAPEDSIYGHVNRQLRAAQKSGDLNSIQKAQALKTLVTQLVYKVAKSRESGGKFSVPDIQFAFQSVGDSSSAEVLATGLDFLVRDVVMTNVNKLRSVGKAAFEKEYTKPDGIGRDNDKLDFHIFSGQKGFLGLDEYQDVMKEYYRYSNREIPQELWGDYDIDFQLNLKKAKEKKEKDDIEKNEIEKILEGAIIDEGEGQGEGQ